MNRVTFQPVSDPSEWDAVVVACPSACAFHSSEWKRAVNCAFPQYRGQDFWVKRDGKRIGGWSGFVFQPMPFFSVWEASPWNLFGGYLPFSEEDPLDAGILGAWESEARRGGACRLVLTLYPSNQEEDPLVSEAGFQLVERKTTHVLKLPKSPEGLWNAYKGSVRTDVRKSRNAQVRVRRTKKPDEVREFYRLYAATMARFGSLAKPESLVQCLVASPLGTLWVAEREGHIVAGLLTLAFARTMTIWMAASLVEERRHAPNHALYHAALEYALAQGYERVDFGASPPENRGLMAFKESFGAKAQTFGTYQKRLAPLRDALWERTEPLARKLYRFLSKLTTPLGISILIRGGFCP